MADLAQNTNKVFVCVVGLTVDTVTLMATTKLLSTTSFSAAKIPLRFKQVYISVQDTHLYTQETKRQFACARAHVRACVCVCVSVCVCVCVSERERPRERETVCVCMCARMRAWVYVLRASSSMQTATLVVKTVKLFNPLCCADNQFVHQHSFSPTPVSDSFSTGSVLEEALRCGARSIR